MAIQVRRKLPVLLKSIEWWRITDPYRNMGNLAFKNLTDRISIAHTNRILVARDPYSRLWSVYLDKFLLPDFWRSHGQYIHRQHIKLNSTYKSNTSMTMRVCASNITFESFIRYVVNLESVGYGSNEHWVPISKLCNPCQYHPDYIIKMETFSRDTDIILHKAGLERVLKKQPLSRVQDELSMLINYNFQLLNVKFIQELYQYLDLCKRLWNVFQINGYLSVDIPFPEELIQNRRSLITKEVFKASVMKTIKTDKTKKNERQKQKKLAMEAAYRKLPISLLRMIPYVYEHDFRLFGYNPYPPGIFTNYKHK